MTLKGEVRAHWEQEPCGTGGVGAADRRAFFAEIERNRYDLEPFIPPFARFERGEGKRVLEVGVGAGTDFLQWVRRGARAVGVDLTTAGVRLARERLALEGRGAGLAAADAENLPFPDGRFDIVYSWGVIHHSPDTARAAREIHRVLKPGGTALAMIYHVPSWMGLILWLRHCVLALRPWRGPRWAIWHHNESPGTKAYTVREARELFSAFSAVDIRTQRAGGDLLRLSPGKEARWTYRMFSALYPRWLVRLTGDRFGFFLLIEAVK